MEERAIIRFKDGTEINAEVNGNNFITAAEPNFPADMSEVTVIKENDEEVLKNVSVQQSAGLDGRYWFIFVTPTAYETLESQVLYTALMTDTLIEEG